MMMNRVSAQTCRKRTYSEKEILLLDFGKVPEHIAIVMDGNRRWAKKHQLSLEAGYLKGAEKIEMIVEAAAELGVKVLTIYSFSTENWNRSQFEVNMLFRLFEMYCKKKKETLIQEGVRFSAIGNIPGLPLSLQQVLHETIQATKIGNRIELVFALNYGGRDEIRRAFLKMVEAQRKGKLNWNEVTEETIASYLDTAPWKDPELFIRTGGEKRFSNFLPWQTPYTEFFPTDVLWPDFSSKNFLEAIIDFQKRNRRHGV